MNTKFNIAEGTIVDFLTTNNILIPIYQRSYAWRTEHVDALIDDLEERTKDGAQHYFGVIAVSNVNKNKGVKTTSISKIIDGQQRLTTILILMKYLYDNVDQTKVSREIVKYFDNIEPPFKYQIENSTLEQNVIKLFGSNYKLVGPFDTNLKHIKLRLGGKNKEYLLKLLNTLEKQFVIAKLIYTIDPREEMLVFENLNSKGTPLKTFDLIRNFIISINNEDNSSTNLKEFNKNVVNLTTTEFSQFYKTEDQRIKTLERFMELFLIFKKEKDLKKFTNYSVYKNFKEFYKGIEGKGHYMDMLTEMKRYASLHLQLATGTKIGENVWLQAMDNKDVHYPLVFSLMKQYGVWNIQNESWEITPKVEEYLKVIAVHLIKLMSVYGTGQSLSKLFTQIMQNVIDGDKASVIKEKLANGDFVGEATPSDTRFETSLLEKPKQKWIPKALVKILDHISYSKNKANIKVVFNTRYTVEHIMPQKPSEKGWPDIDATNKDEFDARLNQIGNLASFDGSANSKMSNKGFDAKLAFMKDSNSPLLTGTGLGILHIFKHVKWDYETIEKRTKILSKKLVSEFKKL